MEIETILYDIGNALRYIREHFPLPTTGKPAHQKDIAAYIKKSDKAISKYENGTINISIGVISAILDIFDLSLLIVVVPKKHINGNIELYSHIVEINKLLNKHGELCVRKVLDALDINLDLK